MFLFLNPSLTVIVTLNHFKCFPLTVIVTLNHFKCFPLTVIVTLNHFKLNDVPLLLRYVTYTQCVQCVHLYSEHKYPASRGNCNQDVHCYSLGLVAR